MKRLMSKKWIHIFAVGTVVCCCLYGLQVSGAAAKSRHPGNEELARINSFLDLMERYIRVTKEYYAMADNHERAAAFAVMEIKTVYTDSGNRQGAIKELNALLQTTQNEAVRNVIRFQLLDLQKESGNMGEAIEILRAIVQENLK